LPLKKLLDQKSESATSYHSKISGSFHLNYKRLKRYKERKDLFVQKAIDYLPQFSQILDLGCGPGVISFALAEKEFRVTGIDGSSEMITLAESSLISHDNPIFLQKNIPFSPDELYQDFDAVILSSVFEYMLDYDGTILLIKALLRDKGILISSIPNTESLYRKFERIVFLIFGQPLYLKYVKNKHSKDEFISVISKSGFVCIEYGYFAIKGPLFRLLDKFLPSKYVNNMLLCVFCKT
jgi:2-polyprenyl-3-methyl-5-hydroxy-6-metoxy-1,4-benzoquinol methylase